MPPEIDLNLENDEGQIEESSSIDFGAVMDTLDALPDARQRFPVIVSVVPYGETILQNAECEKLIAELQEAINEPAVEPVRHHLRAILSMAGRVARDERLRLRFIGS